MIHVLAAVRIKAGCLQEFLNIFTANVPEVLKEKGCIEYTPTVDIHTGLPPQVLDANVVTIIEKWDSVEDLQVHLSAPHMVIYRAKVKDIVEDVNLKILQQA